MTPTTTIIESPDQLDPWGFGVTAADRSVLIEWREPLDEPVDDDEIFELAGPSLPAPSHPTAPPLTAVSAVATRVDPAAASAPVVTVPGVPPAASAVRPAASASDRALLRLPFPPDRLGLMALFGAVIVAQAFYIGFTLTGEASARPADVVSHPPTVVAAPVAHVDRSAATAPPRVEAGVLKIDTGATTAAVQIDGAAAGTSPVVVSDIAPGPHAVRVVFSSGAVLERAVAVETGATVSLVFEAPAARPAPAAGPVSGWLHVDAPFDVQVFEDGQLLGSNATERLMLPAGGHVLEFVNTALGYRTVAKTVVLPGKVASLAVDLPEFPVAINAQPWAEVVVDGRVLGETPLANLMLPLGVHRVLFRHPDLGERVEVVTVRATGANRVAADLRR